MIPSKERAFRGERRRESRVGCQSPTSRQSRREVSGQVRKRRPSRRRVRRARRVREGGGAGRVVRVSHRPRRRCARFRPRSVPARRGFRRGDGAAIRDGGILRRGNDPGEFIFIFVWAIRLTWLFFKQEEDSFSPSRTPRMEDASRFEKAARGKGRDGNDAGKDVFLPKPTAGSVERTSAV